MKHLIVTSLLIFLSINLAASPEEEAEKIFQVMDMDTLLQKTVEQIVDLELQKNTALMPYKKTMLSFFNKYLSFDSLKDDFIKIYVNEFTEQELKEIRIFYSTPTGQKALEKTPILTRQGMELGQKAIQNNLPELDKMIQEESLRIQQLQSQ